MKRFQFVFMALSLISSAVAAAPSKLQNVSTESQRLVLTFDKSISYKSFVLHNPDRVVIDIKNATRAQNLSEIDTSNLPIRNVRYAQKNEHDLRLVFDIKNDSEPHLSTQKISSNQFRLVCDWPIKTAPVAASSSIPLQPKMSVAQRNTLRDVIIVLDPGHGGKDSGAKGYRRTNEKDVVLAIAKVLKSQIDKQAGMRAVLTRTGDYYISLRQRIGFARKANADLFVAIHADAFMRHESSGASVFALSARGASSEAARWLAERENSSELGGVGNFNDKSYLVRSVLLDLSQTSTIQASLQLGSEMLHHLGRISHLHSPRVEQARFVVLKSPDIPSVLVETGFISNPREEMNLRNSSYQKQLASALLTGIKMYFWSAPPDGSLIAAARKAEHHKVARGENLQSIAAAYNINKKYIKKLNFLRGDWVRTGQVLLIPPKTS